MDPVLTESTPGTELLALMAEYPLGPSSAPSAPTAPQQSEDVTMYDAPEMDSVVSSSPPKNNDQDEKHASMLNSTSS